MKAAPPNSVKTVDSSVWIDYFRGNITTHTKLLINALHESDGIIVLLDVVLMEVLRGFTKENEYKKAHGFLNTFPLIPAGGYDVALLAANIYRQQRRRGITIRSAIDLMVAAWCVHTQCPLLQADRDFYGIDNLRPWPQSPD